MGYYCEHIFPWIMEKVGDEPSEMMRQLRQDTLNGISGNVVEIGFGIGFTIKRYPNRVTRLTAIEPSNGMLRRASKLIQAATIPVDLIQEKAETLSLQSETFDSAVSFMTLCTVDNLRESLRQIRRILKVGGRFHFLEHVLSPERKYQRLQNLLNPINKKLACGCNMNRDIETAIVQAGFTLQSIERFHPPLPGWPKFLSFMIRGVGVKNS
jgi:SAM-dependent methyltransferase